MEHILSGGVGWSGPSGSLAPRHHEQHALELKREGHAVIRMHTLAVPPTYFFRLPVLHAISLPVPRPGEAGQRQGGPEQPGATNSHTKTWPVTNCW